MRKKPKERRKQPRMLTAVRNATKERRTHLALWENIFNLSKGKRDRLIRLMDELVDLVEKPVGLSEGRNILWLAGQAGRGRLFPRTDEFTLAQKLVSSKDWQEVMAYEVLLYLEVTHRLGFPEAATDALKWCAKYHLDVPDWVLAPLRSDVLPKARRQGQGERPLDSKWKQLRKDLVRSLAILMSVNAIAAERKAPGYHRADTPMANDRFWRAKTLLAGPWKSEGADTKSELSTAGIRKSWVRLRKRKRPLYLDTDRLMEVFKFEAPTLYKILS